MITGTIYKIVNNKTDKVYVGQTTKSIDHRFSQHKYAAKTGNGFKLGRAIRKHGVSNFTIEIIVSNVPYYFLNAFEKYWIFKLQSFIHGYNSDEGGLGRVGFNPTEETRKMWSKQRKHRSPWNKGKPGCYSTETLQKMREKKLGITPSNILKLQELARTRYGAAHQNAKLADIYDYTTNKLLASNVVIAVWARDNNFSQGNLAATARGLLKQTKNVYAVYKERGDL